MEFILPLFAVAVAIASSGVVWLAVLAIGLTAVSTIYSYQQQQKAAKDQLKSGGVEITRQDSNAGLTIIYGERAVGGVKVWKHVSNTTFAINPGRTVIGTGNANDGVGKNFQLNAWLNRVDTLGHGPVHSITNVEIEDEPYTAPRFAKRNQAIYRGVFMDGSASQGVLSELANATDWKTTSVGSDVAYMYSRFRAGHYSDKKLDRYYSAEPNMRYHVKGRLIWDPRDVAQSSSDPSTWQWSDNPALCLLDYLTQPYGRNLDYSELDIPSFEAAANACDTIVSIPDTTNQTGSVIHVWDPVAREYIEVPVGAVIPGFRPNQSGTTQKRLTCNAALDPSNSVLENVKILLQSMRGTLPYHNGKYSLKLEDVEPTSMSFTEDDIIGGIRFSQGDRSKRYNRTTVVFKNRNKKYKEDRVSWPALDSAEYAALLAEDNNEELFYEIGLDAITDYYQAEDLAEFITMASREQLAAEMQVKSKGMLLEPGDVVEVTHETPGWSARKFRVRSVKVNTDQTATLALTEYNASIYTWRDTSQEPLQEDIGLDSPFDDKAPVTGLAATISRVDTASGVPQGQVELSFTSPLGEQVEEYVVRYKPQASAVFIENVYPPYQDENTGAVTITFLAPQHNTTYDLEVGYTDIAGISGEEVITTFTVPEYRTDLDVDLNTIETEVGEILVRDDGLGGFIPSDLSDLASYYKSSELTLQGNIDTNLTTVNASIASTDATVATLQTQVNNNFTTLQAEVDAAEAAAITADANLQSQVDGINTTLVDLTASTSDVYLQATAPVAGVGGVPNPIPDNSRWYDSDDNNRPYVWDGTQWVDIRDGVIADNAANITALQSTVNDPATGVAANASAISTLDTTVTSLNGTVTTNSSDITALETTVNDPSTGVAANASGVSSLQTTVTQHGTDIAANSTDITALETTVNNPTTGVAANATAISGLDTRVTTAEGTITTQSSDITALETTVNDPLTGVSANSTAISGLDTRVTAAEGSITTQASDITALETTVNDPLTGVTANTTALSGLDTRVTAAEGTITTHTSDITSLENTVFDPLTGVSANTTAISGLDTRVTTAEGAITTSASDITALETTVNDPITGVAANSTGLSSLTTRVTTAEGAITTNSTDITALETTVNDPTTGVSANAAGVSSLDTRVTEAEGTLTSLQATDVVRLNADLSYRADLLEEDSDALLDESGNVLGLENDLSQLVAISSQADRQLDVRVTTAEGTIVSQASDITALQASVTNNENGITGNATAVNALDVRVTSAEGSITSQASDITTLQAGLSTSDGNIAANATAIGAIETRVTSAEGSVTANSTAITVLETDLGVAESDIIVNSTAISGLDTRVTSAEGTITSQSTDITALQSTVDNPTTGVAANATAISSLDTRVTTAEGVITSASSDITTLQAQIAPASLVHSSGPIDQLVNATTTITTGLVYSVTPAGDVPLGAGYLHVLIDGADTDDDVRVGYNGSEVGSAQVATTTNNNSEQWFTFPVTSTTGQQDIAVWNLGATTAHVKGIIITYGGVGDPESMFRGDANLADISANAAAVSALDTRVTSTEGSITSNSTSITTLQSDVGTLQTDVSGNTTSISGNATAISGLDTRVTSAEGSITAQASDITALQTTVNDPSTGVSATASAVSGLETRVTTTEGDITSLEAEYYVNLDVDGHVTGVRLYNTGVTSSFTVQADEFKVVAPGASSTEAAPFAVDTSGNISMNTNVEINGDLLVTGSVDVPQFTPGSLGLIDGATNISDDIFTYTELYRTAFDGDVPHIADVTITNSTDSDPAITAGTSILGNTPLITFDFTTHDWGAGTRPFLLNFVGNVSTGVSSGESEMVIALVLRKTTSATNYTSTTASDYAFTTRKSTSGITATVGSHQLGGKVDLDPNSQYHAWLFVGAEPAAGTLYDSTISISGINK